MAECYVVIVAAGKGSRFGSQMPKQFLNLEGRPVLAHTIDAFRRALPQSRIIVVLSAEMRSYWAEEAERYGVSQHETVIGGATRWESVKNALVCIHDADADALVLVHDGARPLVDRATILAAAEGARKADGAIPAIAVSDSLREISSATDSDRAFITSRSVDRARYRAMQTPQAFALARLLEAYRRPWSPTFTDDASVMEAAGFTNLALTPGSPENIKITNPQDLAVATAILRMRNTHTTENQKDKEG